MKIARNLALSGWYVEWCSPFPGPVAKYAHEKNHIDHPKRAWLMWFFALELNCYEKLWNGSSVYRS